jgi:hypothetical protein
MMKGKSMLRLNIGSESPGSARAKVVSVHKDQYRSQLNSAEREADSLKNHTPAMTPRSQFPVSFALIVDAASQTLLSNEGLQALGNSVTAISSCSTYAAALRMAEQQLRALMMQSVLLVPSRAAPHVISCVVCEGVVECCTSSRVYRSSERVDAFAVVGGEAVALQCCSAARYPAHQV